MDLQADIARMAKINSRAGLPPGGLTGRVLRKGSDADYDVGWAPDGGVPGGGSAGQVLTKITYADGAYDWNDPTGSTGVTGFYNDSPAATSVGVGGASLTWPGFTGGTDSLDLSTPAAPTVLLAGTYTFNFTINSAGAVAVEYGPQAIDIVTSDQWTVAATTADSQLALSLTGFLNAGSIVTVPATSTVGTFNVELTSVVVTRI